MDPSTLEFARPAWLYAGAGVCAFALILWVWFDRRREADLSRLVHARFRARLLPGLSRGLLRTKRCLWLFGVLLLCSAAAGPRMGYEWREIRQRGIDILFAVDTSRSMLAEDLSPNRLERARMGIQDFVERLNGDRVGLIPFAGSSFALCPLTTDYDAFRDSLRALETDLIPRQGTDVGSAIHEAARIFEEQKNNHRILILMTDGEDFQGDVENAITQAKKDGMTVHTIGVGSPRGGRIPMVYPNGQRDYVRDESNKIVETKLDEEGLKKIAGETGGLYAPLGRGAEGLETVYREKLRLVPQDERESRMEKVPMERFTWPLAAGLLLLLLEFLLPDRRREARARALPSAARRHAATALILLAGILFTGQVNAEADPRALYNEGTAAYEAGDFDKAQSSLRASLQSTDLQLQNKAYYNLGNALYRTGQAAAEKEPEKVTAAWESAIKAYEDALALDPADEDAKYNRDLVKRKLEERKNKQKDSSDQKKDEQKKDDQKDEKEKKEDEKQKDSQKQDQQKQDQQKQDEQKQDEQKQGQEKEDGGQKEQQPKDGQQGEQKDGQKQDGQQDQKDGQPSEKERTGEGEKKESQEKQGQQGEPKDQQEQKDGQKSEEKQQSGAAGDEKKDDKKEDKNAAQSAQEKKDGEKKDGEDQKAVPQSENGEPKDPSAQEQQGPTVAERRQPNGMTAEEARQLLKTLRAEEATVLPFDKPNPRQRRYTNPNNSTRGKTW